MIGALNLFLTNFHSIRHNRNNYTTKYNPMLIVISPAKTLDFDSEPLSKTFTQSEFLNESEILINQLSTKSPADIVNLMKISLNLAELNVGRYHDWSLPFNNNNAKQAIYAFKGDVYNGLEVETFNDQQLSYAQDHLRILSGLYGVLRPLDLIQAYRLEMGTKLQNSRGKNLYEFWGNMITDNLNNQMAKLDSNILLNLASIEYFKSIKADKIEASIITPVFKDWKNSEYKLISFFAKKARGAMAAWVLKNQIQSVDKLTEYNLDGYSFNAIESGETDLIFTRKLS